MPIGDLSTQRDRRDRSRSWLLDVLDVLPVRVTVLDRSLTVRHANGAALAFVGLSAEQVRRRRITDFLDPEAMAAQRAAFAGALAGTPQRYPRTTVSAAGETSYDEIHLDPLVVGGTVTGLVVVAHDAWPRVHAQEALQLEELHHRLEAARGEVVDGLADRVEPRLERAADHLAAALVALDSVDVRRLRQLAADDLEAAQTELALRVEALRSPLVLPDDAPPSGLTVTLTTLPGDARVPAPRRTAPPTASQVGSALDLLPFPVLAWSVDQHVRFANRAARERFTRGQACEGRTAAEVLGAEGYDDLRPALEAAACGETQHVTRLSRPRRPPRHEQQDHLPLADAHGVAAGMVTVLRDVTDRVEAERAYRRSSRELARQRDRLRTAEDLQRLTVRSLAAAVTALATPHGDVRRKTLLALESLDVATEHLRLLELDLGRSETPPVDLARAVRRTSAELAKAIGLPVEVSSEGRSVTVDLGLACDLLVGLDHLLAHAAEQAGCRGISVDLRVAAGRLELEVDLAGVVSSALSPLVLALLEERGRSHDGVVEVTPATRGTMMIWTTRSGT